ncbi:MAG: zf-HC2 domain-containing protein [Acidobacteriota bacterium]
MMPCGFDEARVAAYLDGEVSAEEAAVAKVHIAACSACAAEVAEMVALKRGLREARLFAAGWVHFAQRPDGFGEVADLHVNMLASANPYDVVSSDRHTVKPWFQGRVPFSFNVPEFGGSEFALLGGKMVYVHQQPAAQLVVGRGQHRISVLVLQDSSAIERAFAATRGVEAHDHFSVDAWRANGLQFVVVGDADTAAMERLCSMLRAANP